MFNLFFPRAASVAHSGSLGAPASPDGSSVLKVLALPRIPLELIRLHKAIDPLTWNSKFAE